MILLFQFFAWLWSLREQMGPCKHVHYRETRSFTYDGTPWRVFDCKDCGYFDRGHVYCDRADWDVGETET